MSSFVGHSLTAMSIYLSTKQPYGWRIQQLFWLLWLIIIASTPDIDYLIRGLNSSAHQGLRITHSLFFSLILPVSTIIILIFFGLRGSKLRIYIIQLILAGMSHLILDLLVGVTVLPLLWPFSTQIFKLPFGILPSAGRVNLSNYYFYRNLFIEMGVLLPLFSSFYLLSHKIINTFKQKVIILVLMLCSLCFMYWAYSLPR